MIGPFWGHATHDRFLMVSQTPYTFSPYIHGEVCFLLGVVHAENLWARSGTHGGFLDGS